MHRLAVRLDSLGDLVVTGPALRALRHTSDRLTLLCGRRGRPVADLLPGVDDILCWTAPWIDPEPDDVDREQVAELVADLAGRGIDEAVIFTSFHQSALPTALLLRMAGIPRISAISVDYPGSLLDLRLQPAGDIPEPEAHLRVAVAAGGRLPEGDAGCLRVRTDPAGARFRPKGPYVVLHPGTSVPARAWPAERFRAAAVLLARRGWRVVVTGAPDERALTSYVAGDCFATTDLGGRTSFGELATVLQGASAVVVGNTGPAHLAAAVGTPIVSLFAPTVPAARWAPYGVPLALLGDQAAACRGTRATSCPVPGHPCVAEVHESEVADAVDRIARRHRAPLLEGVAG